MDTGLVRKYNLLCSSINFLVSVRFMSIVCPPKISSIYILLHYSIFVNMLGFKQCSFKRMNNLLKPYLMIHKPKQNSILKFCIVRRYRNYNCENDAIFYYRYIFIQNYSSFLRAISKQMLLKPRQKHS